MMGRSRTQSSSASKLPGFPSTRAWERAWQKHWSKIGQPGYELPVCGRDGDEREFLTTARTPEKERPRLKRINDEFIRGFKGLFHVGPAVTVFGSARFKETHPYYKLARATGAELAKAGFATSTGGGPGIMEAANRGAYEAGGASYGLNIILPHEQAENPLMRTPLPGPLQEVHSTGVVAMLFTLLAASALTAAEPPLAGSAAEAEPRPWSSFLPFMADEALKRGYELPLPFGVSAIYNYIERDIEVNDLRLGLNGGSPQSVSRFVDLGSSSRVNVALTRLDVWLLPFVNVYGLFGYVHNQSTTRGTVTVPSLGLPASRTFDFSADTTLDGFVGGGGLTLAGGYRELFLMADVNYTRTDMGFDDEFRALVASMRSGWNGKIGDVPTRLWVGAMYWDTANTATATVNVPGEGLISFEADQGPANPWNASVGASVAISRHWECFAEYGFNLDDVHIFATGLTFRF